MSETMILASRSAFAISSPMPESSPDAAGAGALRLAGISISLVGSKRSDAGAGARPASDARSGSGPVFGGAAGALGATGGAGGAGASVETGEATPPVRARGGSTAGAAG